MKARASQSEASGRQRRAQSPQSFCHFVQIWAACVPIKSPSNSRELPGQEDKTLKISSKVSYGNGFTWQTQAVHVRRCHLYFSRHLQAIFKEMVHWSNIQWIWLIPTDPLAMNCITAELWMVHILHVHSQSSEPVRSHQSDQSQGSPSVPFPDWCYIVCCCSLA